MFILNQTYTHLSKIRLKWLSVGKCSMKDGLDKNKVQCERFPLVPQVRVDHSKDRILPQHQCQRTETRG